MWIRTNFVHSHIIYIRILLKTFGNRIGVIQKVRSLRRGGGGGSFKSEQNRTGGVSPSMCVRSLYLKKMLRFWKWSFIVILQFFLLIKKAVWNIKQTIMKDDNIQSCQWMVCDRFRQPTLRNLLLGYRWCVLCDQ